MKYTSKIDISRLGINTNRVYPKETLVAAVAAAKESMAAGTMLVRLQNDDDPKTYGIGEAVGIVKSISILDNDMYVDFDILDNSLGQATKSILDTGTSMDVRPYGEGSLNGDTVMDDYRLAGFLLHADSFRMSSTFGREVRPELKTIHKLTPSQIKVKWLDPQGQPILHPAQPHKSFMWEVEFNGVDIDPISVISVDYPPICYDTEGEYLVDVKVYACPSTIRNLKELDFKARGNI